MTFLFPNHQRDKCKVQGVALKTTSHVGIELG